MNRPGQEHREGRLDAEPPDWEPYLFGALGTGFYLQALTIASSGLVFGLAYLRMVPVPGQEPGWSSILTLFWPPASAMVLALGLWYVGGLARQKRNLQFVRLVGTSAFLLPLSQPVVRYALGKPSGALRLVLSRLPSDEDRTGFLGTLGFLVLLILLLGLFLGIVTFVLFRRPGASTRFEQAPAAVRGRRGP